MQAERGRVAVVATANTAHATIAARAAHRGIGVKLRCDHSKRAATDVQSAAGARPAEPAVATIAARTAYTENRGETTAAAIAAGSAATPAGNIAANVTVVQRQASTDHIEAATEAIAGAAARTCVSAAEVMETLDVAPAGTFAPGPAVAPLGDIFADVVVIESQHTADHIEAATEGITARSARSARTVLRSHCERAFAAGATNTPASACCC